MYFALQPDLVALRCAASFNSLTTASQLLSSAMLSAVRPSSLRASASACNLSSNPTMAERLPALAIIKAVTPPGLLAFTFAPFSINEVHRKSFEPGTRREHQGCVSGFRDRRVTSAPASSSARVDWTLAFCAAMASGVKPSWSVALSFAPCAISILTSAGLSPTWPTSGATSRFGRPGSRRLGARQTSRCLEIPARMALIKRRIPSPSPH